MQNRYKGRMHRECRIAIQDVDLITKTFTIMKKYVKAQMVAKNLASGSYAAGCPAEERGSGTSYGDKWSCINCERTK